MYKANTPSLLFNGLDSISFLFNNVDKHQQVEVFTVTTDKKETDISKQETSLLISQCQRIKKTARQVHFL